MFFHVHVLDEGFLIPCRDRSSGQPDGGRDVRVSVSYSTLREALKHQWSRVKRRQTMSLNPAAVFIILGGNTGILSSCFVVLTIFDSIMGVSKPSSRPAP